MGEEPQLLSLFLCSIFLLSSCEFSSTNYESVPGESSQDKDSIKDINENPSQYMQMDIFLEGTYTYIQYVWPRLNGEFRDIVIQDEQGYNLRIDCIESNREFVKGAKYRIRGRMNAEDVCMCQWKIKVGNTYVWEDDAEMTRSHCEKTNGRCKTTCDCIEQQFEEKQISGEFQSDPNEICSSVGGKRGPGGGIIGDNFGSVPCFIPAGNKTILNIDMDECIGDEKQCINGSLNNSTGKFYSFKCSEPMKKID